MGILDAPSVTRADINADLAKKANIASGGLDADFFGDSVTVGTGATNAGLSFMSQSALIAGSAVLRPHRYGYAGERSDQILARMPALIAASTSKHGHIQWGTNDASQSVPLSTFKANTIAGVALLREAGRTVSLGLVFPRGSSQTGPDLFLRRYNAWLAQYARQENIPLADTFSAISDPATGFLGAAYDSGDGTHPSNAGHLAIAYAVAPIVVSRQAAYRSVDHLPSPLGLVANPTMSVTTGWTYTAGTKVPSISTVAPTPGDGLEIGNWLSIRVDNRAGGATVYSDIGYILDSSKYSAGDILKVTARVNHNGLGTAKLQMKNDSSAFTVIADLQAGLAAPGPILSIVTVPASPGTLRVSIVGTAAIDSDFYTFLGQCQVINLTTGGLVSDF